MVPWWGATDQTRVNPIQDKKRTIAQTPNIVFNRYTLQSLTSHIKKMYITLPYLVNIHKKKNNKNITVNAI